jgi:hypothetical protein
MRILFLAAIFLVLCFLSFGQNSTILLPDQTEITDKKNERINDADITTQQYRSELSQDEIINFYRTNLLNQGWHEQSDVFSKPGGRQNTFSFVKNVMDIFTIGFLFSADKQSTIYFTTLQECKKFPLWPKEHFTRPKSLDFMPVHPSATQFTYNTQFPPMIGITYLIPGEVSQVINFYEGQMPNFGWQETSKEPNQGRYKFLEWLAIIDPFTKAIPVLRSQGFDSFVPPLDMKGETLKFTQGKKTCTITIYQFPGILAASKGTIFDMWMVEKYGDILVCVYYFSE